MTLGLFAALFAGVVVLLWLIQLVLDYSKKTQQLIMLIAMAVAVIAVVLIAARILR
jgi:hypothetical protein